MNNESIHCQDCCCARAWAALEIGTFTGQSIPEHIAAQRATIQQQAERIKALEETNCIAALALAEREAELARLYALEQSIRDSCSTELNCLSCMGVSFVEKAVLWYQSELARLKADRVVGQDDHL